MSEDKILDEIRQERTYQRTKHGDDGDDRNNSPLEWVGYIARYSTNWMSSCKPYPRHVLQAFRASMIKVAALGVAAVGWVDRILEGKNSRPDIYRREGTLTSNADRLVHALQKAVGNSDTALLGFMIELNNLILTRHPDLFPDPDYYMEGPVQEIKGHIVTAYAKKLSTKITSTSPLQSLTHPIVEILADDIAQELRQEIAIFEQSNKRMCPYAVCISSGVIIDPTTFQPMVVFMTRFGVIQE